MIMTTMMITTTIDDHDDHDDHGHGAHDPHAWLSPENAKLWLNIIASKLSVADPENAATYFTNAAAGQAEIEEMISEVSATLKPVKGGKFVVFHDAYQYFENDFDFYASGAISLSDASDPSPARIAKIQKRIRDEGIQCVLAEPQFKQGLVATVMEGSEATASVIDPLGADIKPGPKLYTQLIKNMAKTLRDCL
jgi:zinc transport system substrate-binding protein